MNPNLLRVTQRIVERSQKTRSAYLARIEHARDDQASATNSGQQLDLVLVAQQEQDS